MSYKPIESNTTFKFINIIKNDKEIILNNINDDDTNIMVLNKLCLNLGRPLLTDEICCYVNNYNFIGFKYENMNVNKVINNNKIILDNKKYIDDNYVNKTGNKKNVNIENKMNYLFENNYPIIDNIIYYFTLTDLIELKSNDIDNFFIYSVIYKFFTNINKNYVEMYDKKEYIDARKKNIKKLNKIVSADEYLMDILNKNLENLLNEQKYTNNLLNFRCENELNNINIINLFSDFELGSKRFLTKLILDDYNSSFYKIYRPELKLRLSDETSFLDKNICNKLLKDFTDNIPLPFDYQSIPVSLQPRNCIIIKSYLKDYKLFYSFILFMEGNYDFIINNYNNINITDEILEEVVKDINILINRINRYRVYSLNKIPKLINYDEKIRFMNSRLVYSMDYFQNKQGENEYKKENLLKYLENFYTHIRIVKEKMVDGNDDIIFKYKRVNNYENLNTYQSIISVLYYSQEGDMLEEEEFIELVSKNIGKNIEEATREYKKWSAEVEKNEFKKNNKNINENGAEIIMSKYLDNYISFDIYNVKNNKERDRIINFIKIFMKLYEQFIKKELKDKISKSCFTKDLPKDEIEKLQEDKYVLEESEEEEEEGDELKEDDLVVMSSDDEIDKEESSSLDENVSEKSDSSEFGSQGGGGRKINKGRDSYSFLYNLQNADEKLYDPKTGISYSAKCTNNDGVKMPIPVDNTELDRINKNDILKTIEPKLTLKEINDYILSTNDVEDLKNELDKKGIEYSEDFPSYTNSISQKKIGDTNVNINYICPKYYDISRRLPVHPRDIYEQIDNIIPPKFKGETEKTIITNEGKSFRLASNDNIKKMLLKFLKYQEIYNLLNPLFKIKGNKERLKIGLDDSIRLIKTDIKEVFENTIEYIKRSDDKTVISENLEKINKILKRTDEKLLALDLKRFNDYVIDKIPKNLYNKFHQDLVLYHQPRFFDDLNVDGYKLPCCFTYKKDYSVDKEKEVIVNKESIRLTDLSPCNYNKFAHIHKSLQNLFGFEREFHDKGSEKGGFINYGVEQGPDALINVLSNFYFKNNDNKKYKKSILIENLNNENSLLKYMKCGDGYILQLFKSSSYDIEDINVFLKYIYNDKNKNKLKKINIKEKLLTFIKNYFNEYKNEVENKDKKDINKYVYAKKFKDLVYKKTEIKFLYDLIISKKNYEKWLKSNEIKDYKYILPFISEINDEGEENKKIYILFENNNDIINIRLPLNTLDIYNDKCIYNFIYKENDIYEAMYYFNNVNEMEIGNLDCDIRYDIHETDDNINNFIKNILDGIRDKIKEIYIDKYKDVNIFQLDDLLKLLEEKSKKDDGTIDDNYKPKELLIDSYCKVSHIITKNNYIYPVLPSKIINGYKLIYKLDKKPTFEEFLKYSKESIIRNKFKIKGFIVNNNKIINIILKNNTYISIEPIDYDKKNKYMRYPILGEKDLSILDKDLQNFTIENDKRSEYNNDIDYLNYITNLTIQNIIYYLKEEKNNTRESYYTLINDLSSENYEIFKIKPIKEGKINIVEIENKFIDYYYYEENKFRGKIVDRKNPVKDLQEIIIEKSLLDEIYLIINNSIKINYDKQEELYKFINEFINEIVVELPDEEYEKYKLKKNISICFDNNDKCVYPCFTDKSKCKLYVKKTDIYEKDKSLINKIIYKFIDLILIHKNIDKISSILQENININDLYKSKKEDEIFFNYLQFQNKYINELFKSESSYIRNINFYDKENTLLNSSQESKPIKSIIKGIPNIINKLFKYNSVLTYLDEECIDFRPLEYSLTEIYKEEILIEKIKEDICNILDEYYSKNKKNMRYIVTSYIEYDKTYKITDITKIKENINRKEYKISPFDLELLTNKYEDIGFLLISSKYSNQDPSKLKHNIIMKYNEKVNDDTKFILLYHYYDINHFDLSNIVIRETNNEEEEYKPYLTLRELKGIDSINEIINKDYKI